MRAMVVLEGWVVVLVRGMVGFGVEEGRGKL